MAFEDTQETKGNQRRDIKEKKKGKKERKKEKEACAPWHKNRKMDKKKKEEKEQRKIRYDVQLACVDRSPREFWSSESMCE